MSVIYYAACSIDGLIADEDGGVAFLDPFGGEEDEYGYGDFIAGVGALLMGNSTYQQVRDFGEWPYDGIPTIVLSSKDLIDLPDLVEDRHCSATEAIAELKSKVEKNIWVVGGGNVAGQCLREGVLDEVHTYTIPVMLGSGIPLFGDNPPVTELDIISTRTFSDGVVEVIRRVRTRS